MVSTLQSLVVQCYVIRTYVSVGAVRGVATVGPGPRPYQLLLPKSQLTSNDCVMCREQDIAAS